MLNFFTKSVSSLEKVFTYYSNYFFERKYLGQIMENLDILLYHTGYCNRAWKKCFFFLLFFRNISKTAETILIKKIERNHGISIYKKALISKHRKIIFYDIIIVLSKCLLVCALPNFVDELAQKLVWISKPNFTCSFGSLRLRAE